jgi:predicted enzyme related to lactoylglutathione lyase
MIQDAKYVHTNLIARDWKSVANFYETVFGCVPVAPERDFAGKTVEAGTGVTGARVSGVHLRLPGLGTQGPTLEVFQYSPEGDASPQEANRLGFVHIAFEVPSVEEARQVVLAQGGSAVGEIVTLDVSGDSRVTWCYVRDPEGNMIELQSWS